jgi:hypothetical protein
LHAIKDIITPDVGDEHVHHTTIQAYDSYDCDGFFAPSIYAGPDSLVLPPGVAFKLGGDDGWKSFEMQIHYDNPLRKPNRVDDSGVLFFWQNDTEPMHEAAMMQLGDPTVALEDEYLKSGTSKYEFGCPNRCTLWEQDHITIFRSLLHMHQVGSQMYTKHYRDDVLLHTMSSDFFDFDNQRSQVPTDNIVVRRGDSFKTECFYNNPNNNIKFGLGSGDEMCIHFLYYYPRLTGLDTFKQYCGQGFFVCGDNADIVSVGEEEIKERRTFANKKYEGCVAPKTKPNDEYSNEYNTALSRFSTELFSIVIVFAFWTYAFR